MVPRKKTLLSTVADMIPGGLLVILGLWLMGVEARHESWAEGSFRYWLWQHRHHMLVVLALMATVTPLAWLILNITARRRAIRAFLDRMHARFWIKGSKKDPEYRISLYVPGWSGEQLVCRHRTDDTRSGTTWSTSVPKDGRAGDGVVGAAWLTGMVVQASSPPKNPTDEELSAYRQRSHITEARDEVSWPEAAMLAVPVHSLDGGMLGVLLFERNKPDAKVGGVTIRDYEHDVHVLAMILEGSL